MKKRLLIFPFDLLSHYLRCITLAKKYPEYEILFADSPKYRSFIEKEGYKTFEVESFDAEHVMQCAQKFDFSWLNRGDIERVFKSQVNKIKELQASLVIGDTSPTLKMASEVTNVKYVALMNGYMSRYYSGLRSVSRTHYSYEYVNKLPPTLAAAVTRFAEQMAFKQVHRPFRELRRQYQLKKVSGYLSEMEGDENLICDTIELFPQKKLPENYKIIGPLSYETSEDETELIAQVDPAKKTICVSLGSSGDWNKLLFLSELKYADINIIVAGDLKRRITGPHIITKDFVNLDKILPYCSFMICHGGNGTIYTAIKHKIFLLCLTNHFEQEWNAERIASLGLGLVVNDHPQKIIDNVIAKRLSLADCEKIAI